MHMFLAHLLAPWLRVQAARLLASNIKLSKVQGTTCSTFARRTQDSAQPDPTPLHCHVCCPHHHPLQGHNYTDMVLLIDFAYDVPASFQEGKGLVGGFTMRTINTSRLCFTTISQACLKVKGPDVRMGAGVGGRVWVWAWFCLGQGRGA